MIKLLKLHPLNCRMFLLDKAQVIRILIYSKIILSLTNYLTVYQLNFKILSLMVKSSQPPMIWNNT